MKLQLTDLVATTNEPTSAPAKDFLRRTKGVKSDKITSQKKDTTVKAKAASSLFHNMSRTTDKKSEGTTAGKRSGFLGRLGEHDTSEEESSDSNSHDSDAEIRSNRPASLLGSKSASKKQKTKQDNSK